MDLVFYWEVIVMDYSKVKKATYFINTMLLLFVIGLMGFFIAAKADFLVIFSIPTTLVYVISYYLISKRYLYLYVNLIYFWIILYMGVCTVCLGYNFGFNLYCMSLIPILYYMQYIGHKIHSKRINAVGFSILIVVVDLSSAFYSIMYGPIYKLSTIYNEIFFISNSLMVFGLIIFYSVFMVKAVISSENSLERMAHIDGLTGLYNRHYMMNELNGVKSSGEYVLAMIDIDDFKKINDNYGHNAGDYVLKELSTIMTNVCVNCKIARWGGEEFLVFSIDPVDENDLFEALRATVHEHDFTYEATKIPVSITVGVSRKDKHYSIDQWIKDADNKLYDGKRTGKNKVVI